MEQCTVQYEAVHSAVWSSVECSMEQCTVQYGAVYSAVKWRSPDLSYVGQVAPQPIRLHIVAMHSMAQHCTALNCTARHSTALHLTTLHCTELQFTLQYETPQN